MVVSLVACSIKVAEEKLTGKVDGFGGKITVEANSAEVEAVSRVIVTIEAIIYAVNNALNPTEYPYDIE